MLLFCYKKFIRIKFLGWLRGKKEAIINNDNINNNDFQNALDDALNYQTIEKDSQRISKLKSYINKYNWEGINFPAGSKDWKKFERNNDTITLNILYVKQNTKTIRVVYESKYKNKRKNQVMIVND